MSGIKGNWTVSKRGDGTGGNLEVANTLTADTLIISNSVTLPGVIIDEHSHTADAIVSGVIDADRLPKGDGNDEFGVIKIGTAGGLDLSDGILTIDAEALSTLLQLGTAAGADTGTASGNVPILDGSGRLPISVMPAQTIGGEYLGEVANAESMVILSQATSGDFCKRLDTGTYWMLGSSAPGAYSTAANWLEYAGAVTSVNGVIGAVTQSDLGLVTAVSANSDTTFPSCKAIAGYIAGQISDLNLAGTYVKITALENYATAASVSELQNYVDATYATTATVRGMIENALTGYVSPSSLEAALANYAVKVHTHTSAQISDATRTGGQNADAGKAVLLSDGGKIAGAMVPADGASIVLSNGTISVSDSWLAGEVHGYTKTEVSAVSGTVLNLTKSGQVFDKSLSADATITLNTSGLVVDAGEAVEFDLFLTLGAGVTAHLPGWMTGNGPIYNYAEEGKTLFHVWSYNGGTTWNASKESWLPPDNWEWVTTLSDAIGHQGTSLRDAIGAANNGDVIKFLPELEGTITLEQGELTPTKRLTIDGGGKITIDANRTGRIFNFSNSGTGGSEIKGLTLTKGAGGNAPGYGGGAVYANRPFSISDCIFIDNHATDTTGNFCHGGAVYCANEISITNSKFINNTVTGTTKACYGGALYISTTGSGSVVGCLFDGNQSIKGTSTAFGGGLCGQGNGAQFQITDCTFVNNYGYSGGGLTCPSGAMVTIENCVFENNRAMNGGAVRMDMTTIDILSSTFKGNVADSAGGSMYIGNSSIHPNIKIVDCLIDGDISANQSVYLWQCEGVEITGCKFKNVSGKGGLVIVAGDYDPEFGYKISGCSFEDCFAPTGTPLTVVRAANAIELEVENCVFHGNKGHGGASSCMLTNTSGATLTARNNTFTDNTGANVFYSPSGTLTLYNSVEVGCLGASLWESGATVTVDYLLTDKTYTSESVTNITTYDSSLPLFDEDGYTPVEGSQTIDAGNSEYVESETDINGNPRIVGEAVDLGAVEYQGNAAALTLNRLNVIRNLNRMNNLNSLNLDQDGTEEELALEPELIDETEHEEWLRQQELNGGDQR